MITLILGLVAARHHKVGRNIINVNDDTYDDRHRHSHYMHTYTPHHPTPFPYIAFPAPLAPRPAFTDAAPFDWYKYGGGTL